jgi:cellulose synthase/poly-beta-1,6-N-acetylglucosamine synthase-like glycosyltransferase
VSLPLVSCICPTYGRPPAYQHLLEEAIESFLRQDYPNKELIVLNDCPGQELVCDAPGVRVVNAPERFATLGEKYNAAVDLAHGDLLAPWEDDDISLPWRLSLSVERLGDADYFNPQRYWFLDDAGLHFDHDMGYGHNLSLFTRRAFEAVGGYPAISGAQDAVMDGALRSKVGCVQGVGHGQEELSRREWYYIYRWGVQPVHFSASAAPENLYEEVGMRPVQSGSFRLHPHWHVDYEAAVLALMARPTRTSEGTQQQFFRVTGNIPEETWYWAALASIGASALLKLSSRDNWSRFVGQLPPIFLLFGLYHQRRDPHRRDEGQATLRILEATYGNGDSVVDVATQLQELVRKGCLLFTVSNSLFGDPCPSQLKTLRFTYQLPEDDRQYTDEVSEHQVVLLPDHGIKRAGIC